MKNFQKEQTGLPSYEEETSFGGDKQTPLLTDEDIMRRLNLLRQNSVTGLLDISGVPDPKQIPLSMEDQNEIKERAKRFIKSRYPYTDFKNLAISFSSKNPLELVFKGPRKGEYPVFLKDGSDFQQCFFNQKKVQNALGRPADSFSKQASDDIRKMQKKKKEMNCARMKNAIVNKKNQKKKKN